MKNSANQNPSVVILGAGSFGTALAILLARSSVAVTLWGNDSAHLDEMEKTRKNERYIPGIAFPDRLLLEKNLEAALFQKKIILIAVPSHALRSVLHQIKPFLDQASIVLACKGVDPETHELSHEIVEHVLGEQTSLAVLSGPSFAKEVAAGLPTAVTIASKDPVFGQAIIELFHAPNFRAYYNDDLIGVEIGGAVKNVIAIAVGACDGLNFGANARAALITRGLAEMTRLGLKLGAKAQTFQGLAGIGDLVLTCTDNQSRNRRFGLALAKGESSDAIQQEIGQVVEGFHNAKQVMELAQKHHVEMPITQAVYEMLYENLSPQKAAMDLLARASRPET